MPRPISRNASSSAFPYPLPASTASKITRRPGSEMVRIAESSNSRRAPARFVKTSAPASGAAKPASDYEQAEAVMNKTVTGRSAAQWLRDHRYRVHFTRYLGIAQAHSPQDRPFGSDGDEILQINAPLNYTVRDDANSVVFFQKALEQIAANADDSSPRGRARTLVAATAQAIKTKIKFGGELDQLSGVPPASAAEMRDRRIFQPLIEQGDEALIHNLTGGLPAYLPEP